MSHSIQMAQSMLQQGTTTLHSQPLVLGRTQVLTVVNHGRCFATQHRDPFVEMGMELPEGASGSGTVCVCCVVALCNLACLSVTFLVIHLAQMMKMSLCLMCYDGSMEGSEFVSQGPSTIGPEMHTCIALVLTLLTLPCCAR